MSQNNPQSEDADERRLIKGEPPNNGLCSNICSLSQVCSSFVCCPICPNWLSTNTAVVKVHSVVSGKTLDSHKTLLQQVEAQGKLALQETNNPDTCDVIILFCPIVSRMGSDVEVAMKRVPDVGNKDIIRVMLHHTFNKDYTIPHVSADSRVKYNVNALFHDTKAGLLQCEVNHQAVLQIHSALLQYSGAGQHQYETI